MQHEVVHRRSGIVADSECVTIPGLQRITSLRYVLRCARETTNYVTFSLTLVSFYVTAPISSLAKGAFRMRSSMRSECGARARSRKPLPGGSGPRTDRHDDRSPRC